MFSIFSNISTVSGNFFISDFFDILIMTFVIYSIFLFLRRTRSYMVFLGLAIIGLLYLISNTFNLYLTFLTLRYFVGVSVVVFVVIFQTEIRKYFEFLGFIGTRNIKVGKIARKSPLTSELIQACIKMAQDKIGALIIIQGKDNIESLVDGGTIIDGVISEDLLLSIFDPHSDGHDGAVIIADNRISKFGAHLPLSTNFKLLGKGGTRHSAALGLAENSDALAIVVSEEKGHISLCYESKLKKLADVTDLEKELNKYIKEKFESKSENKFDALFKENFLLKIFAITSAVVLWFFTAYQAAVITQSYNIPIVISDLPENTIVDNFSPKEIKVTIEGRGQELFDEIDEDSFEVVINASEVNSGITKLDITEKHIQVPSKTILIDYDPTSFLITATKYSIVKVPLLVRRVGEDINTSIDGIAVSPENVEILVPEGIAAPLSIQTEAIDVSNVSESIIIPVKVIYPEHIQPLNDDISVNVAVTVK